MSLCAAELPSWLRLRNGTCAMKSQIEKRSVIIAGRRKSISLEEAVWRSVKEIATYRDMTLGVLLATIDSTRNEERLSQPFVCSSSTSTAINLNFKRGTMP